MDHHFPSSPIRRRLRIPFPRRLAANARASRLLPFSAVSSAAKRACAVIEEAAAAPTLPAADLSASYLERVSQFLWRKSSSVYHNRTR